MRIKQYCVFLVIICSAATTSAAHRKAKSETTQRPTSKEVHSARKTLDTKPLNLLREKLYPNTKKISNRQEQKLLENFSSHYRWLRIKSNLINRLRPLTIFSHLTEAGRINARANVERKMRLLYFNTLNKVSSSLLKNQYTQAHDLRVDSSGKLIYVFRQANKLIEKPISGPFVLGTIDGKKVELSPTDPLLQSVL